MNTVYCALATAKRDVFIQRNFSPQCQPPSLQTGQGFALAVAILK